MSVGAIRGLVHQVECSPNLLVTPATTTAEGLSHRLPLQVHSLRHRRTSRNVFCPQKSPPLQLSGCMELWLLHTSCPRWPFLFLFGFVFISGFMTAMEHVRRARRFPSSDTTLYEVLYVAYATAPLTPRVLPRWWKPVGG